MTSVELPWPHKLLWPNETERHGNQHRKRQLRRNARTFGWGATLQALGRPRSTPDHDETVAYTIIAKPPMRRGKVADEDNLKAALKHFMDGVSDALGVDDSRFRCQGVTWLPREGEGAVTIQF